MMDIPVMLASNVLITDGIIYLTYSQVDSGSIFGIRQSNRQNEGSYYICSCVDVLISIVIISTS